MLEKPTIIKGESFSDDRGLMRFVNDFRLDNVKRFYLIKHPDPSVIRAWQGHQYEKKYFYPISGTFVVAWVKIDDFKRPDLNLICDYHILSAKNSEIIMLPKGYANGIKALEANSELMIFSDMSLKESVNEKISYPSKWWFDWDRQFSC